MSTELLPDADYGCLTFDWFALEKANGGATPEWREVVDEFLALGPAGREPYESQASQFRARRLEGEAALKPSQISYLEGFQTAQERNLAIYDGLGGYFWLRTNYGKGTDKRHEDLLAGLNPSERNGVLNDPRYAFDDWREVIYRLPHLVDNALDLRESDIDSEADNDAVDVGTYLESNGAGSFFVADDEAFRTGWILIVRIDRFGQTMQTNRVRASSASTVIELARKGGPRAEIFGYAEGKALFDDATLDDCWEPAE